MNYFVTGATGFIGKFLVEKLLQREGSVYVLLRQGSEHKLEALRERYPLSADRIIPVYGDLGQPMLGISEEQRDQLRGNIAHFFHVAAIYDLTASAESQQLANVEGTRNAVRCAQDLQAGCFQHTSSIAVGGKYEGTFREGMFKEAGELNHPYFRTKHDSEGIVRTHCRRPWRVYRPAIVVGHSKTGEIDKLFALASSHVTMDTDKVFKGIMPIIQKMMETMQQYKPQPQMTPEAQVLKETSMAETQRRAQRDQADVQLAQQKHQDEIALAQAADQTKLEIAADNNETKERIEAARITKEATKMQHEQQQTALTTLNQGVPNGY